MGKCNQIKLYMPLFKELLPTDERMPRQVTNRAESRPFLLKDICKRFQKQSETFISSAHSTPFPVSADNKKAASPLGESSSALVCHTDDCSGYPKWIASEGQTSAQVPHSVQASGLIEYLSPSEIAPTGHSSIQVPHAIQSSLIT